MSDIIQKINDATTRLAQINDEMATCQKEQKAYEESARASYKRYLELKEERQALNLVLGHANVQKNVLDSQAVAETAKQATLASQAAAEETTKRLVDKEAAIDVKLKELDDKGKSLDGLLAHHQEALAAMKPAEPPKA